MCARPQTAVRDQGGPKALLTSLLQSKLEVIPLQLDQLSEHGLESLSKAERLNWLRSTSWKPHLNKKGDAINFFFCFKPRNLNAKLFK